MKKLLLIFVAAFTLSAQSGYYIPRKSADYRTLRADQDRVSKAYRAYTFPDAAGTVCLTTTCGINTISSYSMGTVTAGEAPGGTNQVDVSVIYLPDVSFSHITVDISTADSNTGDFYSWAITDTAGNVKCSMSSAVNLTATGTDQQSCSQGTVTLANGNYIFAFTGNATTAKIAYSGTAPLALSSAVSTSTSSSGAMTFPIAMPTAGQTFSSYGLPAILLN